MTQSVIATIQATQRAKLLASSNILDDGTCTLVPWLVQWSVS
jgi:hypothetical protein